jgi:hypothetical protein
MENTVEFTVDVLDYGRHGVIAKEPRTGLTGSGDTREEALDDLRRQLWYRIDCDDIPPAEGPVRSIETITV